MTGTRWWAYLVGRAVAPVARPIILHHRNRVAARHAEGQTA